MHILFVKGLERNGESLKLFYKKGLYFAYFIFVASLSVGWKPETDVNGLFLLAKKTNEDVETMCAMNENKPLFEQGVAESEEEDRQMNEQNSETIRRQVKAVIKEDTFAEVRVSEASEQTKEVFYASDTSRQILERIVEAEAGDQDIRGRRLVANVILNRVRSQNFPDTVRGVVFAHRQFSPVSNGSYYRVNVSAATKKAVRQALNGVDDSEGALYFMWRSGSDSGNVSWFDRELTKLFSYGCHEFFK